MLRTQIYLPEYEYKKLREKARVSNKTFAQTVRELLQLGIEREEEKAKKRNNQKVKKSGARFLLGMAREAERLGFEGPPDSSVTIDQTLYGFKK